MVRNEKKKIKKKIRQGFFCIWFLVSSHEYRRLYKRFVLDMWFIATIWLNLPKDDGPFFKFFLKNTHTHIFFLWM